MTLDLEIAALELIASNTTVPIDTFTQIERRGASAFVMGLPEQDNPYISSCSQVNKVSCFTIWKRGWHNARQDAYIASRKVG